MKDCLAGRSSDEVANVIDVMGKTDGLLPTVALHSATAGRHLVVTECSLGILPNPTRPEGDRVHALMAQRVARLRSIG